MRILPAWLREFVDINVDDRQLAEDLTSAGIAVESIVEESGNTIYEMDLTTNRVDAMNHYGVAREASAIYNVELKKLAPKLRKHTAPLAAGGRAPLGMTSFADELNADPGIDAFPIVIDDAEGCARYTARIVQNVQIGPSPKNIAQRLELLGSRSINNVADATNYALNELGHPTHAFDLDLLEGGTIIVRRARAGEALKTLDGVDRKLTTDDLVIADGKKPVALAGVMGGFDTMITERTKNVLIESAWFDPATVRSMAKRHGMHTDASHRFERGADWGITPLACDRVAELILAGAGGELHGERIDTVARTLEGARLELRRSEIKRNLGIDLEDAEVARILQRLGFGVLRTVAGDYSVQHPPGGWTSNAKSISSKNWRGFTATTNFPTPSQRSPARSLHCPMNLRMPRSARPCWRSATTRRFRSRSSPSRRRRPSETPTQAKPAWVGHPPSRCPLPIR